jgi:hypothetical protein
MKMLHLLTTLSLGSVLLFAEAQNKELEQVIKLGNESTATLVQTLGKNMKEHMKKGGPMDALNFCSNEAYSLTESVNKKLNSNVKIKRVSTEFRSVANKPDANEKIVLDSLMELQKSGVILPQYIVQKVGEKSFKYYKPIMIDNGVCLKCHGNLEDEKIKTAISKRYPQDKAVGYKMNDLRGAVVAEIETK